MLNYLRTQQFIETIFIVAATFLVIILVGFIIKKTVGKGTKNKPEYLVAMKIWRAVRVVLIVITLLGVLSVNGIHMGSYLAGLGIASAIAGFALQDPIRDIIMGMTILAEGHFKIGDTVEYKGEIGKIAAFNIKTTWIFMFRDEKTLVVSNREITEIALASDWIDIDIPVGYDVDLYLSRALCREAAKRIERLRFVYSCDFLNTQELAENWINYRLRIHCLPEKRYAVERNANAVVQDVFYENNTPFSFSITVIQHAETQNDAVHNSSLEESKTVMAPPHKKRVDYELGKGAVKSKICVIDGSQKAVVKAINEAERYAIAENLGNNMKMRIRLLSEEAISMIQSLTDIENGEFYIQREGIDYEICLDANAGISSGARKKLVSVSSSGSNSAYEGISGIINRAIDTMIMKGRQEAGASEYTMEETLMDSSIIQSEEDYRWSLNKYRENQKSLSAGEKEKTEDPGYPDSLEMSVLSKFSDDIKIAVRANHVNIRILVKDTEEE